MPRKSTQQANAISSHISNPPPAQESPAERLFRAQESAKQAQAKAEQMKQAVLDAENVAMEAQRKAMEVANEIVEQERRAKAEAKKREEEIQRAEAKKKEEARQRIQEAKKKADLKGKETGSQKNHPQAAKGRGKVAVEEEEEGGEEEEEEEASISRKPATKPNTRKKGPKTPAMIDDSEKSISSDLVSGALYPSCLACFNTKKVCQWKWSVIHLRLSLLPNKAKNCENCVRSKEGCHLAWDRDETLKRPAESAMEPQSPKRIKVESATLVTSLERIDNQIGALIKLAAAQAKQNAKEHQSNTDLFEELKTSLEALHEKAHEA